MSPANKRGEPPTELQISSDEDFAVRCAAGAIAGLGPKRIQAILDMPDQKLGRKLKQRVIEIVVRFDSTAPQLSYQLALLEASATNPKGPTSSDAD